MKFKTTLIVAALGAAFSVAAHAQQGTVQRDINQQQRVEQGLKSGALTTREAAGIERRESKVERDQARALKDGTITPQEKARLAAEQNSVSRDITRQKNDAQVGNPNSASSQRMQADVQRDINQQQRIKQGVQSGSLTNRETARLEAGQAHDTRLQARSGADGHVDAAEQARIQRNENRQSRRVFRQKHDAQSR